MEWVWCLKFYKSNEKQFCFKSKFYSGHINYFFCYLRRICIVVIKMSTWFLCKIAIMSELNVYLLILKMVAYFFVCVCKLIDLMRPVSLGGSSWRLHINYRRYAITHLYLNTLSIPALFLQVNIFFSNILKRCGIK